VHNPRRVVATALSLVAVLAVAACGSSSKSSTSSSASASSAGSTGATSTGGIKVKPKTLGVLSVSGSSQSVQTVQVALQSATKALGWKEIFVDAEGDPVKLTKGAASIALQKPDAFIAIAVQAAQIRPQLVQMQQAGIPTCQAGLAGKPDPPFTLALGEDEYKLGQMVGQTILKDVPNPKIIVLANPQNISGVAREQGLKNALKANPNAKIVFRQVIDFADPAGSATKAMQDGLAKNPDANAIYPVFDFSLPPALQVIHQRGSKAQIFGHYTSSTTTPELRKASSPVTAVIDNNAGTSAALACLDQYLKHFQTGAAISQSSAPGSDDSAYTYNVVDHADVGQLVKPNETLQFTADSILAPFLKKWKQEYPAK
jgi:ABC-type sugar transport system substrate-binding protein